jgi:putative copper export protein/mono/diheme cytochrome c family protein/peroxiredoxin
VQALTPDTLWSFIAGTQYGRVWSIRLALMALLGALLCCRDQERDATDWWSFRLEAAALAVSILLAQVWMGHAAAGSGVTLLNQLCTDGLHLFAGGVWLGGLPLLVVLLSWAQHDADAGPAQSMAAAVRRFSALGLASMSLLIISGLLNARALVGSIPALVGTTYGRLLLLKLSLLLPLLALAALNLCRERPRLRQAVAEPELTATWPVLARLRRNVLGELLLGVCILVVVGALGIIPPALHAQPTWPFSWRLSWEATKDLPGVRTSAAIGIQVSMFGCFAALIALLTRLRHWSWAVAAGGGLMAVGCALWLPKLMIDAYPTTYVRPSVPYHTVSIANGLRLYEEHCAACHGQTGNGDGPAAAGLRPRPADLTAKHTTDHTAGDLFWWLTHGIRGTAMPPFEAFLSAEERWDLINAVRALATSEQARLLGPIVSPTLRLVAPDFSYTTAWGDTRSLKDFRSRDAVLLVFYSLPHSRPRLRQLQQLYARVRPGDVEVLGIPLGPQDIIDNTSAHRPLPFPLVRDGAAEAAVTYTLFASSLSTPDPPAVMAVPSHLEFLVDRSGFLRGRWRSDESDGWRNPKQLLTAIEVLQKEKRDILPPDLHVH